MKTKPSLTELAEEHRLQNRNHAFDVGDKIENYSSGDAVSIIAIVTALVRIGSELQLANDLKIREMESDD